MEPGEAVVAYISRVEFLVSKLKDSGASVTGRDIRIQDCILVDEQLRQICIGLVEPQ